MPGCFSREDLRSASARYFLRGRESVKTTACCLFGAEGAARAQLPGRRADEVALPIAARLDADELGRIGLNLSGRRHLERLESRDIAVKRAQF